MDSKQIISELAQQIKAAGFRVFIAERGTYGFYTDEAGTRVVSFGADLGGIRYSGNYKTSAPNSTGTGWHIGDNRSDFADMFNAAAPRWAVGSAMYNHTTLAQHLKTYQPSSRYEEVK